jgi:hypothetical protein
VCVCVCVWYLVVEVLLHVLCDFGRRHHLYRHFRALPDGLVDDTESPLFQVFERNVVRGLGLWE